MVEEFFAKRPHRPQGGGGGTKSVPLLKLSCCTLSQRTPFQLFPAAKRGPLGVTPLPTSLSLQKRPPLPSSSPYSTICWPIHCLVNGEYQALTLCPGNLYSNCSGFSEVLLWGSFLSFAGRGWERLNIKPDMSLCSSFYIWENSAQGDKLLWCAYWAHLLQKNNPHISHETVYTEKECGCTSC